MKRNKRECAVGCYRRSVCRPGGYYEQHGRRVCLMQGQKRDLVLRSNDVVRLESPKGEELAVLKSSESKLAGLGTVTATVEGRELSKVPVC